MPLSSGSQEGAATNQSLCDVVALSTLPAMWHGTDPVRIAESLAASLFTTLNPVFVYVCFFGGPGKSPIAIAQTERYATNPALAKRVGQAIHLWARSHDPDQLLELPNPSGPGLVHVTARPIGFHAELGVIAAAFADPSGPTAAKDLLLSVAATQAATAVQNAHLLRSLRESEERFRAIINQTNAGIAQTDRTGRFKMVNERYCQLVGYSSEELLQMRMQDITHPEDLPPNISLFQRALTEGTPFVLEKRYVRKNGSILWVQNSVSAIRDASGSPQEVVAITVDITERKQAEAERAQLLAREREAREEAETLNAVAMALAGELDLQKLVQTVTDAGTKLSGAKFGAFFYNVTNQRGESYLLYTLSGAPREAFEKFGMPRNTELFAHTFHGTGVVRSDDVLKHAKYGKSPPHHGMPKGHLPVRSYLAVPVKSRSGEVMGGLFFGHPEPGIFTERAERICVGIAAQAAIAIDNARLFSRHQQSEERYRSIFETVGVSLWQEDFSEVKRALEALKKAGIADFKTYLAEHPDFVRQAAGMVRLVDVNQASLRLFRAQDKGELLRSLHRIFVPETEQVFAGELLAMVEGKPYFEAEAALQSLRGDRIDVLLTIAFGAAGENLERVLVSLTDITGRKRAEEALRESEERFRHMANNAPVMVWVTERDGACSFLSQSWYDFTGQTPETGLGFGWLQATHPDDQQAAHDTFLAANRNQEAFRIEYRLLRKDGEYRWAIDSAVPRFGPHGEFLGYIGSVIDITDRKAAEEALRKSHEDLRRHAEELTLFNRVAVGRELRMVELKNEINELCQQQGLPPRYSSDVEPKEHNV